MIFDATTSMDLPNPKMFPSLVSDVCRDSDAFESRSNSFSSEFASPPPAPIGSSHTTFPASPANRPCTSTQSDFYISTSLPVSYELPIESPQYAQSTLTSPYDTSSMIDPTDEGKGNHSVSNYGEKASEEYRIKRKRNNEAVKKARIKFNVKNHEVQKRLEVLRAEHEVLILKRNQIRSNYELIKSVYEDAMRAAQTADNEPKSNEPTQSGSSFGFNSL
jgi:hypothetical protein